MKHPRKSNVAGNVFDKYETRNPLYRLLVNNFLKNLDELIGHLQPEKILEIGCGEGFLTNHLATIFPSAQILGADISPEIIKLAKAKYPQVNFVVENTENLSFRDKEFSLVLACEVLEHLKNPTKALKEIKRVLKGDGRTTLSVPREPIWRLLNMCRLKYVSRLGNTPGHVNHWGYQDFVAFVKNSGLKIQESRKPFPWTMLLVRKN